MVNTTKNNYIVVQVTLESLREETLRGKSSESYVAVVLVDSQGEYQPEQLVVVTKGGLILLDDEEKIYAINRERIIGIWGDE